MMISQDSVLAFTKALYFLVRAGVPLHRALVIIETQNISGLTKTIGVIAHNIAEGKSFAESLRPYQRSFGVLYIRLIAVGESRGELAESLERLFQYMEYRKDLQEKIVQALTYPAILLALGFAVLLLMILVVLPQFTSIFATATIKLPLPTKIVLALQYQLLHYGFIYLTGLVSSIVGFWFVYTKPAARLHIDRFILHIPVVGVLVQSIEVARFCRTFGTLYNSGVQLLPALELSVATMSNTLLQREISLCMGSVRDGKGLAATMAKAVGFPQLAAQMIAIGEETGGLEHVLLEVARYYEQDTHYRVRRLVSVLEPVALLCISLLVAFIAASIMLPLFRMSSVIRSF